MKKINTGLWTLTEDRLVIEAVEIHGSKRWESVSRHVLTRTSGQCRHRWLSWLNPALNREPWSQTEDARLLEAARLIPAQWETISQLFNGSRTAAACHLRHGYLMDNPPIISGPGFVKHDPQIISGPGFVKHDPQSISSGKHTKKKVLFPRTTPRLKIDLGEQDGKVADTSSLANNVAKIATTDSAGAKVTETTDSAGAKVTETTDSAGAKVTEAGSGKGGISASTGLSETPTSRLESLIHSSPVILLMKGKPDEPKCGFNRKVIDILVQEKVDFESFDVLSDEEVRKEIRQGFKVHSKRSSYPQLYIKGELIGGSDIVLEMQKSGELKKVLAEKRIVPKDTLEDRVRKLITSSPVMVFIKGTPDAPKCGFSSKVIKALREEGLTFGSFDILSDEDVKQGLKVFSNGPTFPQLYYKGELIGGCDIIMELKNNGELKSTLTRQSET